MFRIINGCKRVIIIDSTRINYGKYADFDDSYLYKLKELDQLIRTGDVKVIYNLNSKKTIGYKLEKKQIFDSKSEITEKNTRPKIEDSVEEVVEEIIETKPKSNKRKKQASEDEENNETN